MNYDNISLLCAICIFSCAALLAIWNNWIFLDHDGRDLTKRPSFLKFYYIALINLFRFFLLKKPIRFRDLY